MSVKPTTSVEKEVFEIWKELSPSTAFGAGLRECAGHLLIADPDHLHRLGKRIDEAIQCVDMQVEKKFLSSVKAYYFLGEAQIIPDIALDAFFTHMVKEGIKVAHMISLALDAVSSLRGYSQAISSKNCPIGIRVLTSIRCAGLKEVIESIRKASRSRALHARLAELEATIKEYSIRFGIEGFKNAGFEEIVQIFTREKFELGREENLPGTLADLFDYKEGPSELELKGLAMLARELSTFKKITASMAMKVDSEERAEAVALALNKKRGLKPEKILSFIRAIRKSTIKLVDKYVVRINPRHRTKIMRTPSYLAGMLPTGAAYFLDFLTRKPVQLFLATIDPRRAPMSVPGELLNLLVHEEYGHCVHSSNSACHYAAKPTLVELLPSMAGNAVSEGISFQREVDFLKYLKSLQARQPTRDEKLFVRFTERYGGLEQIVEEYEFYTQMWRIVRFLRVIGDARINMGSQGLLEFIEWAHEETGLSKSLIYHQLFPAHEGNGPGYASTYAIVGESIAEIQRLAERNGKDLVAFNTYASSMGFPPRSIFERRLREYATY